jgi:hypothetical protein
MVRSGLCSRNCCGNAVRARLDSPRLAPPIRDRTKLIPMDNLMEAQHIATRDVFRSLKLFISLIILSNAMHAAASSISPPNIPQLPPPVYSSIVLTHSQPPRSFSFHRLTRLSPPLTASTLPAMLQLHLHTTTSKSSVSLFQLLASAWSAPAAHVQMRTV